MFLTSSVGTISVWLLLWMNAVKCEENAANAATVPDCKNGTCVNTTFTPPPASSMSRLLPSAAVLSNDTKETSASFVDIITTPETDASLGLSAFSQFAQTSDHASFNPSPFLGVIHDKGFPRGVAVGEVFPDTVGEKHLYQNKYLLHHKGYHHVEGLKHRPDPFAQILTNHEAKPTPETVVKSTYPPIYKTEFRPTVQTLYTSTKTPEYPFVFPDKHFPTGGSKFSITEYKPPFHGYQHSEKPISEEQDDIPFGHDDRPKFPVYTHHGLAPFDEHKKHLEPKNNKWKSVLKLLATVIPFGLLVAAFSPSILVVNATEPPASTKTNYRSLEGIRLPVPPAGVNITHCQMKEICEGIYLAEKNYQPYLKTLIKRSGGVLKEIAEISAAGDCSQIPCKK
ncbi:uncharacterized protein LOC106662707 [Cimex lectularius]|uniref:CPR type cuticle protein n=1 Tax=Cimex lectularius TaxID=79782 RepID=A0A8I6RES8_CIMLE|nr:uncharacterized protein LOC106662707 [Cimex lectularius]XP_014242432.1 uncharacterized protein LOC106662707 [Cimex lectularius]XP_024081049.1 uncharacterized protein LOC106662707 [Cimex lectularius]